MSASRTKRRRRQATVEQVSERPFRLSPASWIYVTVTVGLSMVAGVYPVALGAVALTRFATSPAGVHASWSEVSDPGIWAALWMLGAGVVLSLFGGAASLAIGYGQRGNRLPPFLLASLIPLAFGLYIVGSWTSVEVLVPAGVGLLILAVVFFLTARRAGAIPVERHALVDSSYSVFRPWTYQAGRLLRRPNSPGPSASTGKRRARPGAPASAQPAAKLGNKPKAGRQAPVAAEGPPRVAIVTNWLATVVGWLVIPGVFASYLLLAWGRVWWFAIGATVSLTVPWWLSRRMSLRRVAGTRQAGMPWALGAAAAPISVMLLLVGSLIVAAAGDVFFSDFATLAVWEAFGRGYGEALGWALFGLVCIVLGAFCVPMFSRRPYAAATARAWVSWGVYLLTVVVVFVAGDGWPVAGSRWQGWGLFAMLTVVVTLMVWQLRRVRPAPRAKRVK